MFWFFLYDVLPFSKTRLRNIEENEDYSELTTEVKNKDELTIKIDSSNDTKFEVLSYGEKEVIFKKTLFIW